MTRGAFLFYAVGAVVLLQSGPGPAAADHQMGGREQWQPQFTVGGWHADERLHTRVTADMLGRSATTVLAELSEQAGVSLQIAPEDVDTVGERKLSLFLREAELRSVMVQIPEALRECHWDIDRSGAEPVYYLHRNAGGADLGGDSERERLSNKERARRVERLEAVKRALAMTPGELKEFEKEDLPLALAMQDPDNRAEAALFLMLSADDLQTIIDDGRVQPRYADLSPELKGGFERLLTPARVTPGGPPGPPAIYADAPEEESIGRWREGDDPRVDFTGGTKLGVGLPGIFLSFPIPPRFPTERDRTRLRWRLMPPGFRSDAEFAQAQAEADQIVSEWMEKMRIAQAEEADGGQYGPDREPTDPALLQHIAIDASGRTEFSELQQEIAAKTGLQLVCDFFTEPTVSVSAALCQPTPLWQLLNVLASDRDCVWQKAGPYLVFHHIKWADLAPGEMPESLIDRHGERIAENGHLTIDDVVEFALAWEGRSRRRLGIPRDLQEAGLSYPFPALMLYAALTPEQIAAARRPEGLPCRELFASQRQRLADVLTGSLTGPTVTMEQAVARGSFHVEETRTEPNPARRVPGRTEVLLFLQVGEERPQSIYGRLDFPEIKPSLEKSGLGIP